LAVSQDELSAGTLLGPYELMVPVGSGGMARVWAAKVRGTGQVVALKMLHPEIAENPAFQEMFFDEARIAQRVHHPNVCVTYELGHYDGVFCLAMEWVDGASLMHVLRPAPDHVDDPPRVPLHPRLAARIVAEACAGLHAAHELVNEDGRSLGVVHRDASPHNILLTTDGHVKITDFGVAKALGKSSQTIAGQIKGKLAYMSPEQLMGGAIDRRSDVFALGCVLYELTLGVRPFQGEHDPQTMTAIIIGRYEPPSAVAPGYPTELEAIITHALGNEPDQRFATAEHMRQALEGYLRSSGPPVTAADVAALLRERCGHEIDARDAALHGGGRRLGPNDSRSGAMALDGRPASERRAVMGLVAAVLLGSTVGLGILWYVHGSRKPKTDTTVAKRVIELDDPATGTPGATSATAVPSAATAGTPGVATVATGVPTAAAGTSTAVHLHITPPTAVLVIDGVVMPSGTETVARPADGGTVSVLVRADKYQDTIVLVDPASSDDVDVALVPATVHRVAPKPKESDSPSEVEAPPNPYE
jgi:tRNA A-37 threonylcarbamoyl transferase component Bud32